MQTLTSGLDLTRRLVGVSGELVERAMELC